MFPRSRGRTQGLVDHDAAVPVFSFFSLLPPSVVQEFVEPGTPEACHYVRFRFFFCVRPGFRWKPFPHADDGPVEVIVHRRSIVVGQLTWHRHKSRSFSLLCAIECVLGRTGRRLKVRHKKWPVSTGGRCWPLPSSWPRRQGLDVVPVQFSLSAAYLNGSVARNNLHDNPKRKMEHRPKKRVDRRCCLVSLSRSRAAVFSFPLLSLSLSLSRKAPASRCSAICLLASRHRSRNLRIQVDDVGRRP